MKLKQHIPNAAFDPRFDKKEIFTFDTVEELEKLEWVARFTKMKGFHRLSLDKAHNNHYALMQETNQGWWVIGHIDNPTQELIDHYPKWEAK